MVMELTSISGVGERMGVVDLNVFSFCGRLVERLCELASECETQAAEFFEDQKVSQNLELYFVSVKARELMNEVVAFQRSLERDPEVAEREKNQATQDFLVWLAGVAEKGSVKTS